MCDSVKKIEVRSPNFASLISCLRLVPSVFVFVSLSLIIGCGSGSAISANNILQNSATLSWDANTEPDLAGYNLYYWIDPDQKQAISLDKAQLTHTFTNLLPGDYFFAVTAFDVSGNESPFSTTVSKTLG